MAHETVPADIAAAIDALEDAADTLGMASVGGQPADESAAQDALRAARAALDAAILHHLRSAERACDSYARENQQLSDRADELKAALELQSSGGA